jgi:hypothetical protein
MGTASTISAEAAKDMVNSMANAIMSESMLFFIECTSSIIVYTIILDAPG